MTSEGDWHLGRLAVGIACLVLLLVATISGIRLLFDSSPPTLAKLLFRRGLAGDAEKAESYLEDNAVQLVEFERWHLRHLSSLRYAYRPKGDRVTIEVAALAKTPEVETLEVILESESVGTRSYKMRWDLREVRWVFDDKCAASEEVIRQPRRL